MLAILTVIALTAAVVCGGMMWRVLRNDRRRAEARIAVLASAIDGQAAAMPPTAVSTASLFEGDRPSAMRGRPLLKVASGFAVAVAVIVLIAMIGGRATEGTKPAATQRAETAPLELASMRHSRTDTLLTVTGLVRNPGTSSSGRLIAVVLVFDRNGDFVASGRAPLEFATLAPGDESPFQVTIPGVSDVGRYRVSFRTESGVVRHVDRRVDRTRARLNAGT